MNIRQTLSGRISLDDIRTLIQATLNNKTDQDELFKLVFDSDDHVSYQAGWVLSHWPPEASAWLIERQDQLIDAVLTCRHNGKKRVMLTTIYRLPLSEMDRVDFLDFCLESLVSGAEAIAVRSICMKIAYEICRPHPELLQEFKSALD